MTVFTRLVIAGSHKRATLAVPSEEPVASHLGTIAQLIEEPDHEGDLLTLVHATGSSVDLGLSPAGQGLLDGTVLHLVRSRDTPPEPQVSDVSALVAREHDASPSRKTGADRRAAATLAAGMISGFLGMFWARSESAWIVLLGAFLGTSIGVACAALQWRQAARLAAAVSTALTCASAIEVLYFGAGGVPDNVTTSGVLWALLAAVSIIFGTVFGAAERRAAPSLGAVIGVVLGGTGVTLQLVGLSASESAAIVALACAVVLALLPELALSISGLARLDAHRLLAPQHAEEGTPGFPRHHVLRSLASAHASLQWAVAAVAVALLTAIPTLLLSDSGWFVALGGMLGALAMLRSRLVPLSVSAWALWGAVLGSVGVVTLRLVFSGAGGGAHPWLAGAHPILVGALCAALVLTVLLGLLRPSAYTAARVRRQGDLLESVLAISLVPVMLGGCGVYGALLGVF